MSKHQRGQVNTAIERNTAWLNRIQAFYLKLFPHAKQTRPALALKCRDLLRVAASKEHRRRQNEWYREMEQRARLQKRLMLFLVPPTDVVSGGLMSICNIAQRSQAMQDLHGCEVVMATMPGRATISGFSQFECSWKIFRYEQIERIFPHIDEVWIQIPEMCVADYGAHLKNEQKRNGCFFAIPERKLNILNQNIELMPVPEKVKALSTFFHMATQTCAHGKYCTPGMREKFDIPTHLLPADIPATFYKIPFSQKENLIAYSNDQHPQKEQVLARLHELLPEYQFLMIEGMTFEEYKQTISRAKWTLTFGEGWDGYFIQPYSSDSIGLCVFNEAFCPPVMKTLPTVFPDYETLPERMAEFIRTHDEETVYNEIIPFVLSTLFPPPPPDYVYQDPLGEFYRGNYTIQ